ncbi:MAG: glycosyltransferase family 4 protein [Patescibacteria group bacterium]|nr:glycosyltransferase family 4 protein [Patescibacteria group bacterium]
MTILFFTRLFYPHIGGVEKHVLSLSLQLIKKGYKIIIITENHGWKEKEACKGLEIIRINSGTNEKLKKFVIWKELWKHKAVIAQADIVHCHDVFFWYLPFGYLHPTKPVYVTFHGYEGNTTPGIKAIFMHKLAEFSSDKNICIGSFLTKWYHTKATIISYGATDIPKKIENKKLGKIPTFLYIGRLEEEAGILEYVKALGILKQKGIDSKLIVLGDGTQRREAQLLAKEFGLDVDFQGFVENVESFFPKADYVFTSRYLGILEAFAHKKYVFAIYNSPVKKDYLTMTPFATWIATAGNVNELTDKIMHSMNNKNQQTKSIQHSFSWVKAQTWENLTKNYLALWNKKNK